MKKRLDILVYEKGFTDSREKAKAIIMSGQVYVDNQKADKCGTSYDENVKIEVRGNTQKYVSRGGTPFCPRQPARPGRDERI